MLEVVAPAVPVPASPDTRAKSPDACTSTIPFSLIIVNAPSFMEAVIPSSPWALIASMTSCIVMPLVFIWAPEPTFTVPFKRTSEPSRVFVAPCIWVTVTASVDELVPASTMYEASPVILAKSPVAVTDGAFEPSTFRVNLPSVTDALKPSMPCALISLITCASDFPVVSISALSPIFIVPPTETILSLSCISEP